MGRELRIRTLWYSLRLAILIKGNVSSRYPTLWKHSANTSESGLFQQFPTKEAPRLSWIRVEPAFIRAFVYNFSSVKAALNAVDKPRRRPRNWAAVDLFEFEGFAVQEAGPNYLGSFMVRNAQFDRVTSVVRRINPNITGDDRHHLLATLEAEDSCLKQLATQRE